MTPRISCAGKLAAAVVLAASTTFAQIDLSGEWAPRFHEDQPERIPGPEIGDYLGLPINEAARAHADSWHADILTVPEHQCKPHPADYGPRGPANLRFWKEIDTATQRLIAWHTHIAWMAPERTIWMDGRPHPPAYAPHTWQGFSTGQWDGDILTVTTTHLKTGWIRRNGVPRSDRATLVEHWIRHADSLTLVSVVHDPAYLTEPFIRTTDWELDPRQQIDPYPCESVIEVDRPRGAVPNHLPGKNPFLYEFADKHKVSHDAVRGGSTTTYPGAASTPAPLYSFPLAKETGFASWQAGGNVTMLVTPTGNMAVQIGPEGVLVVDALAASLDAVRKLSPKTLRYVIDTNGSPARTASNEAISAAGSTLTGGNVAGFNAGFPATIIGHENVTARLTEANAPAEAWPMSVYHTEGKDLYFNGESIRVIHAPAATSNGDSIVHFRRSDVLVTGDIFTPERYPAIDVAHGGSINGVADALNVLLDLAIPAEKEEGGTMIIPGSGRLCDEADVLVYRDMVTIVRDRIQDMVKRGLTLDQVKAARPTLDYDTVYGNPTAFIEAAYASLSAPNRER